MKKMKFVKNSLKIIKFFIRKVKKGKVLLTKKFYWCKVNVRSK